MKTLIVYATKYGSAEKAAEKLKEKLQGDVTLINVMEEIPPALEEFVNVILGGSIYMGKVQQKLISFIKSNISELMKKRVGIYICAALNPQEKVMRELYEAFPELLYNKALAREVFGYEFHFEKMGFIERKMTSSIMGIKNSVSKLDEEAIESFARVMNFMG